MAAMRCPACGRRPDGQAGRVCPTCLEPYRPVERPDVGPADVGPADVGPADVGPAAPAVTCPEPACGMPLDPAGRCPVHALGERLDPVDGPGGRADASPPALRFPWGVVEVGAERLPVGRSPDAGPLAPHVTDGSYRNVSRRHAELWCADGCLYVQDLGSTNGTFVNESRIDAGISCRLRAGDVVRFAADLRAIVVSQRCAGD